MPFAAEEVTENVTVEVLAVAVGLNAAVTPLGNPDTPRVTLPLKPFSAVTVIVAAPMLDRLRLSSEAELDSRKEGRPDVPVKSLMRC